MQAFSPLRFRVYARDLSEAISEMSQERMQTRIIGSNKFVTVGGKTVMVSPMATDQEIATALGLHQATVPVTATPLPPAPTLTAERKPVASSSFAASLKAMLDEAQAGLDQARADGRARVGAAVGKLNGVKAATAKVANGMAQQIEDAADSALSDLGQISNDL